jgi:hypothetical protein
MQAIGQERHKDVRLNPALQLVEDGPQAQIVLQILEGRLDLRQLNVKLPEPTRVLPAQVAA